MAAAILTKFDDVEVSLIKGSGGIFDVALHGWWTKSSEIGNGVVFCKKENPDINKIADVNENDILDLIEKTYDDYSTNVND